METRANYVLIGAFVLMAAAALALFAVWISGSPFRTAYTDFDVRFEGPVNGLTEGGEVRFNGIKVGEVKSLSLERSNPNNVIARIRVENETPVKTDSVAQLNFQGVTGVSFIQILAGKPGSPELTRQPGQDVPVIRSERTALDELFAGSQDMFTEARDVIRAIKEALNDENVESVTNILHNLDIASRKLSEDGGLIDTAKATLKTADVSLKQIDEAAKAIDVAATGFDTDFKKLSAQADDFLKEARPIVTDARQAVASFNATMGQINDTVAPSAARTLSDFSSAAGDLRTLVVRLQGLAGEIEQDPSRFVYQKPQPVEKR
jgi:phospholipid/cholesterol/gamma-HCH transport system substrate-binding protein